MPRPASAKIARQDRCDGTSASPAPRHRPEANDPMGSILTLQRTVGNRAVGRLLGAGGAGGPGGATPPAAVRDALGDDGRPLDPETRAVMEARFGEDFDQVRIHADAAAAASATAIGAAAYTVGRDVVFGAGGFRPDTARGKLVLAHELAHVVQQRRGGSVPALDRSAPHEGDATAAAEAALTGQSAAVRGSTGTGLACVTDEEIEAALAPLREVDQPTTETGGGRSANEPLTPDELWRDVVQAQRGHLAGAPRTRRTATGEAEVTRPKAPLAIDPEGVGRPLGTGYETHAALQVVDRNGRLVTLEWGSYQGGGHDHAEIRAIEAARERVAGQDLTGSRILVVVDQAPCPACAGALAAFKAELGAEQLDVYGPNRATAGQPEKPVSAKTAARTSYQGAKKGKERPPTTVTPYPPTGTVEQAPGAAQAAAATPVTKDATAAQGSAAAGTASAAPSGVKSDVSTVAKATAKKRRAKAKAPSAQAAPTEAAASEAPAEPRVRYEWEPIPVVDPKPVKKTIGRGDRPKQAATPQPQTTKPAAKTIGRGTGAPKATTPEFAPTTPAKKTIGRGQGPRKELMPEFQPLRQAEKTIGRKQGSPPGAAGRDAPAQPQAPAAMEPIAEVAGPGDRSRGVAPPAPGEGGQRTGVRVRQAEGAGAVPESIGDFPRTSAGGGEGARAGGGTQGAAPAESAPSERVRGLPLRGAPSLRDVMGSTRGRARGAGAEAIGEGLNRLMFGIRERNLRARIEAEFRGRLPEIEKFQTAHPDQGVLVVVRLAEWNDPVGNLFREYVTMQLQLGGETEAESWEGWHNRGPELLPGLPGLNSRPTSESFWIPPGRYARVTPERALPGTYRSEDETRRVRIVVDEAGPPRLEAWDPSDGEPYAVGELRWEFEGVRSSFARGAPEPEAPTLVIRATFAKRSSGLVIRSTFRLVAAATLEETYEVVSHHRFGANGRLVWTKAPF